MSISLRDQFAMAAMPSLMMLGRAEDKVAELAYKQADAMIVEYEKSNTLSIQEQEAQEKLKGSRVIRRKEVEKLTGLGASSIYALMDKGEFPRPLQISERTVAWRLAEVEEWLANLTKKREVNAGLKGGVK